MARFARNVVATLEGDWEFAETAPGAADHPAAVEGHWAPARASTVASALGLGPGDEPDLDAREFWYRRRLGRDEIGDVLRFGGLATLADVWIDGEHVLRSDDMFVEHAVDASRARAGSVIAIRFASLARALAERRPRPRWRATIVAQQQLRWFRTSLLGRIPAWTPPIAPVGIVRPITIERFRPRDLASADVRARLDGRDGIVEATLGLHGAVRAVDLVVGEHRAQLVLDGGIARGATLVPNAPRWWPHTHGAPSLVPVTAILYGPEGETAVSLGATGFRALEVDRRAGAFTLHVNGVRTFCRGACWMPLDIVSLSASRDALRATLVRVRDAGMNMLRLSGTMFYESPDFHALCDELGILVWQDFMFANMDYPHDDERFATAVRREATQLVDRLQLSPSLAVLCGGSEVEQQAAMMGLPETDWSSPLFRELLPEIASAARPDVAYVPSSPSGGALPFDVDTGVSHYYGVGAYMRPLEDARRARVRFTSECLAFANLPCEETIDSLLEGDLPGTSARWKRRVARDRGTAWDFEDVRDHYVRRLFDVDPDALRRADPARWVELGRVATGDAMAAAMSEWRRAGSECGGALVWFLRDLWEGAGFGVIDARGLPKSSFHYLRRVLAPVALLAIDEGLNGLALHAVNDRPIALACELRVALFRSENLVAEGTRAIALPGQGAAVLRAHELIGRFTDVTWAYRFGPPAHDVTFATLVDAASGALLGRAFHYPRGLTNERSSDLGVEAFAERIGERAFRLTVRGKRALRAVAIDARGFVPEDDFFDVAPGESWSTVLTGDAAELIGTVRPLNATAPTRIAHHAH